MDAQTSIAKPRKSVILPPVQVYTFTLRLPVLGYMQGKQTASFAEIVSEVWVALTLNSIDQ
jgi:hypothetical protein